MVHLGGLGGSGRGDIDVACAFYLLLSDRGEEEGRRFRRHGVLDGSGDGVGVEFFFERTGGLGELEGVPDSIPHVGHDLDL